MNYFNNISYMISHFFLMLFFYLFTIHRYSQKKTVAACLSSFLILCLADCVKLNLFPNSNICYFCTTMFQIIVVQSTNFFIAKRRNVKVLFMGLSASNYVIAGSLAASILHICTGNMIVSLIGSCVVHFVILCFLCVRIRRIWLKCYEEKSIKGWWELCLIPVFFYCAFSSIAFFPQSLYDNPDNILGSILFIITMFISYVIVMRYVESEERRLDIFWKNVLFESYIKGLESQYDLVERSEKNLKILRHDMRHYFIMISSLLDVENYDEIRKVIEYINDVVDENRVIKYCSHFITNMILSNAMDKAHSLDVVVHLDALIPKQIPVNDYEFASVIANLFENAMDCVKVLAKEKRHIDAKIRCTEEYLLIDMRNEYEQKIEFDSVTGLPKSQKGENHGLGMQSVFAFSDKIGGSTGCYCEGGIFQIVIFAKF